jgi:hypothetical protein
MERRPVLAILLLALIALAGCTGADGPTATQPETNNSDAPAENSTTTPPADDESGAELPASTSSESVFVFDHGGTDAPVIENGLAYNAQNTTTRRYATLLQGDELDRLNTTLLAQIAPNATRFVNETAPDEHLLVYQETPASSFPNYRLSSVQEKNASRVVTLNDSARAGTADITVETVLVRVSAETVGETIVRLEDGTEVAVEE